MTYLLSDLSLEDQTYVRDRQKYFIKSNREWNLTAQGKIGRSRPDLMPYFKHLQQEAARKQAADIEAMKRTRAEYQGKIDAINKRIRELGGQP